MSHGRIAKTKSMIYWETNLKWTLKTLSPNEHIEPGRNKEYIAAYSCSIFILQRQDEHFKEL